jgi:hypothetical protein
MTGHVISAGATGVAGGVGMLVVFLVVLGFAGFVYWKYFFAAKRATYDPLPHGERKLLWVLLLSEVLFMGGGGAGIGLATGSHTGQSALIGGAVGVSAWVVVAFFVILESGLRKKRNAG